MIEKVLLVHINNISCACSFYIYNDYRLRYVKKYIVSIGEALNVSSTILRITQIFPLRKLNHFINDFINETWKVIDPPPLKKPKKKPKQTHEQNNHYT